MVAILFDPFNQMKSKFLVKTQICVLVLNNMLKFIYIFSSHWITPQLIPITKSPKSSSPRGNHKKDGEKKRSSSDNEKYRFAFKNPKKKEKTSTTPTPETQTPPTGDIVCKKQLSEQEKGLIEILGRT